MPQAAFPFFPEGVTHITALLAFRKRDARITYFNLERAVDRAVRRVSRRISDSFAS